MIDPDPNCLKCKGSGGVAPDGLEEGPFSNLCCLPCGCRMEPNNCDRCATLACGETRAPSSRWKTPDGSIGGGTLCKACRALLCPAHLALYGAPDLHEPAVITGRREGLMRLREALDTALYTGRATFEALTDSGHPYQVLLCLDEGMGTEERRIQQANWPKRIAAILHPTGEPK